MSAMHPALRIAVCDDAPALRLRCQQLIERWSMARGIPCQVSVYACAQTLLFETEGVYPFDLMLLDVEMPGMDGMALARRIRETDARVPLAFLTQHTHFVYEGYEVGALRYLLKPQMAEKLPALLDELLRRRAAAQEPAYLLIESEGEMHKLDPSQIIFVEARGHDTLVHLCGQVLRVRTSFSAFITTLPAGFAAAHRSYVVNLAHVERISRAQCRLSGGIDVPVSRSAFGPLNQAFLSYYKEAQP